jgi:asparagine N-glycosylation enzyme membrane subunit Stt3
MMEWWKEGYWMLVTGYSMLDAGNKSEEKG